ncbi:GLPGLI family protein [Riemerella columbipharyngis]|uniref:GLPGLI family protein n=1 Tax=Riemerella columbipharyngis TaxID=1071918 RepID=A0A1G7AR34_9FLAO|nr:GLPGLI family protein [Riemerella columbipharyngis]
MKISIIDDKIVNNVVTAWFTPDIPIHVGPSIFSGLPVFIILLNYNHETYLMKNMEQDINVGSIAFPTEGTKITEEGYLKYIQE